MFSRLRFVKPEGPGIASAKHVTVHPVNSYITAADFFHIIRLQMTVSCVILWKKRFLTILHHKERQNYESYAFGMEGPDQTLDPHT